VEGICLLFSRGSQEKNGKEAGPEDSSEAETQATSTALSLRSGQPLKKKGKVASRLQEKAFSQEVRLQA